jgi:DNA (cytosine-5)-methyltransferase 1
MKLQKHITQKDYLDIIERKKYENHSDNGKAALTHYANNRNSKMAIFFESEAVLEMRKILKYKYPEDDITNEVAEEALQYFLFDFKSDVPFPEPTNPKFTFIDLFAGIGGFRLAMQNFGGKCVFTSEWDENAKITYKANFGEVPFGDITKEETKKYIPNGFDILCAGFPCQAFSIAGYQKGFHDTRGTLFFDIEQIVENKRPKVVFLENVKNLVSHDNGITFKIIMEILEKKLGYVAYSKVLNSVTHANIPQNRERIFIVAFDPKQVANHLEFRFPEEVKLTNTIHDIIIKEKQSDTLYYKKEHPYYPELAKTITSNDTIYQWRRVYVRENKSKVCPTLTANMGAGGHNVPLIKDGFGIRKLSPRECFLFQGYPPKYILPNISSSKLYMQAGNSVTTTLVERICKNIVKIIL